MGRVFVISIAISAALISSACGKKAAAEVHVLHDFVEDPFLGETGWYHKVSNQTQASFSHTRKAIRIDVDNFDREKVSPKYYATVNCTENVPDIEHYRSISIELRGSLDAVRFYLENPGKNRLRSRKCAVKASWSTCVIDVANMGTQRRHGKPQRMWYDVNEKFDTSYKRFSIKLGRNINPYDARGWVEIGPITFKR